MINAFDAKKSTRGFKSFRYVRCKTLIVTKSLNKKILSYVADKKKDSKKWIISLSPILSYILYSSYVKLVKVYGKKSTFFVTYLVIPIADSIKQGS